MSGAIEEALNGLEGVLEHPNATSAIRETLERARDELALLKADNAALLDALRHAERLGLDARDADCVRDVLAKPHPGTALLERFGEIERAARNAARDLRRAYSAHGL